MRRAPVPDSVTLPLPSITIRGPVLLTTFAVCSIAIVIGSAPQSNVITPPPATAATTAALVQLAGVPSPITVVGCETSSRSPPAGAAQLPLGLPAGGPVSGSVPGSTGSDEPHATSSNANPQKRPMI